MNQPIRSLAAVLSTTGTSAPGTPVGWWVQVPAAAYAGVYTSTATLEVISGP